MTNLARALQTHADCSEEQPCSVWTKGAKRGAHHVILDQLLQLEHNTLPHGDCSLSPFRERRLGGLNSSFKLLRCGFWQARDHLLRCLEARRQVGRVVEASQVVRVPSAEEAGMASTISLVLISSWQCARTGLVTSTQVVEAESEKLPSMSSLTVVGACALLCSSSGRGFPDCRPGCILAALRAVFSATAKPSMSPRPLTGVGTASGCEAKEQRTTPPPACRNRSRARAAALPATRSIPGPLPPPSQPLSHGGARAVVTRPGTRTASSGRAPRQGHSH